MTGIRADDSQIREKSAPILQWDRMWSDLAPIGRHGRTGGYRRYSLTAEDAALREWFAGESASRGLDLVQDRAGNQWAWWCPDGRPPGPDNPGLAVGSHLDSVPDGGAFDGPLGVVSSLAALDALRADGFTPDRPIAVVHFGDEEGAQVRRCLCGFPVDHRPAGRRPGPRAD